MVHYFGLPARLRSQLAGRWVSLITSDSGFKTVAADVTLGSELDSLLPTHPLALQKAMFHGRRVVALTGRIPAGQHAPPGAQETLYVSTGPRPLPVGETYSVNGASASTTITR